MRQFFTLFFSLLLFVSCTANQPGESLIDDVRYDFQYELASKSLNEDEKEMLNHSLEFSFSLFSDINGDQKDNFVISPMSVNYLLGMLSAGADGNTRKEILSALGYKEGNQSSVNEFYRNLLAVSKNNTCEKLSFELADAMVVADGFPVLDSYKRIIGNYYDAMVVNRDFKDNSIIDYLNNWASEHTHGKITQLVTELPQSCCAVLLNSLYFKGNWKYPFYEELTKDGQFFQENGAPRSEKIMTVSDDFYYYEDQFCQVVNLPYEGEAFYMRIVLPKSGVSSSQIMKNLNATYWKTIGAQSSIRNVSVKMPKFNSTYRQYLKDYLINAGIQDMFGPADFRNMTNYEILINEVLHIAMVSVDEAGTEGASVSAAFPEPTCPGPDGEQEEPIKFYADHPFIYAIAEKETDSILFLGCYK